MTIKDDKWTDLGLPYLDACHGVQTGVMYEMNKLDGSGGGTSPKHLRTGINIRACEHSALAKLLIEKGLITEEEYLEAIRLAVNHEVARYEAANPPFTFR